MTKKIAISQSNYIPWKGYFDMIASVDEFILYDDMQYTRRDWRNRNQIKTPQGVQWLTIPVKTKGKYFQTIRETEFEETPWKSAHWKTLFLNYGKAPFFQEVAGFLEPIYLGDGTRFLSSFNRIMIENVCRYLGIGTEIKSSWDYVLVDGKSERLANLCLQAGASEYVSGPAAKDYLDRHVFENLGIRVNWFEYTGYPEYPQLWGDFVHGVSILDLLFNCGRDTPRYMRHVRF